MTGAPGKSLTVVAPAKINLYLHLTDKRDDGYHELDSLVAFADIHDTLDLAPADILTLEIDGPFADHLPVNDDNMVLKAARALQKMTGEDKGAAIRLTKNLPLSSGIGGGSTDAAATLKGLLKLWHIAPPEPDLMALALSLGADVPVCVNGRAVYLGGIGEKLTPAPALPTCSVVLVNPGTALSTPAVFKAWGGLTDSFSKPAPFDYTPEDARELASILMSRRNDLTSAAKQLAPEIDDVLMALRRCDGALMTRMSGSGATCFALFTNSNEATEAVSNLAKDHPDWWIQPGTLETNIHKMG